MKRKIVSFLKKEPVKRAVRTFGQTAAGYIIVNIASINFTGDRDVAKSTLIGLGVSAIAAGLSAVMNLQKKEEV